ncbi:MAG: winged helix-turn-helix domain-containing protein [Candidatus Freyarchaeota archaeon]
MLDVLGNLQKKPLWPRALKRALGLSYACIYDNLKLLEEKGFVKLVKKGRKGRKIYDVTLKGALASLFSPHYPPTEEDFTRWQKRDWGERYVNPFQNVKSLAELKGFIETIYNFGVTLEDINEDILKRGLRNPKEIRILLQKAKLEKIYQAEKAGKHLLPIPYVPGSFGFLKRPEERGVMAIITPQAQIGEKLFDLLQKPANENYIGKMLSLFLERLTHVLASSQDVFFFRHYSPEHRFFIISGVIPKEVASRLLYPEQILTYVKNSYVDIINWLSKDTLKKDGNSIFLFRALKYDPEKREITPLSKREICQKATVVLRKLEKQLKEYEGGVP